MSSSSRVTITFSVLSIITKKIQYQGAQNWTVMTLPVLRSGSESPSSNLLPTLLLMQPRVPFLAIRARFWLVVNLESTRIPRPFSAKLPPSCLIPGQHPPVPGVLSLVQDSAAAELSKVPVRPSTP